MYKITDLNARKNLHAINDNNKNKAWVDEQIKKLRRDQLLAIDTVEAIRIGKAIKTLSKKYGSTI